MLRRIFALSRLLLPSLPVQHPSRWQTRVEIDCEAAFQTGGFDQPEAKNWFVRLVGR
jgi:hypothetical protein